MTLRNGVKTKSLDRLSNVAQTDPILDASLEYHMKVLLFSFHTNNITYKSKANKEMNFFLN